MVLVSFATDASFGQSQAASVEIRLVYGQLQVAVSDQFGQNAFSTANLEPLALRDGTWHHVLLIWNIPQNYVSIYLDGVLAGSGLLRLFAQREHLDSVNIGRREGYGVIPLFFEGYIDDLRIYNVSLDTSAAMLLASVPDASQSIPNNVLESTSSTLSGSTSPTFATSMPAVDHQFCNGSFSDMDSRQRKDWNQLIASRLLTVLCRCACLVHFQHLCTVPSHW
jgi:hypothetical protein